jgi:uncharacterized protein YqjF (DUF2071 family)
MARALVGLPYRWARMSFAADGAQRCYTAHVRGTSVTSRVVIRVGGPAADGPLERFLTARWGLHVARAGGTRYLPNAHEPWPLRTAEVLELDDGLVAAAGLAGLSRCSPDHVVFSDGVAATFGRAVPATRPRAASGS